MSSSHPGMRSRGSKGATTPLELFAILSVFPFFPQSAQVRWERNMKKRQVAIMTVGLALFGFVATKLGWRELAQQIEKVCMALPILFALSAARTALQTAAWSSALRARGIRASVINLVGARLASRAMGYLSVLGPLVSEPMRISLLEDQSEEAVTASLIDTGVFWVSCWLFTILRTLCAVQSMSGQKRLASLLTLTPLAIGAAFLMIRRKPVLPGLIQRLGKYAPSGLQKGEHVEVEIRAFQAQHPGCIRRMFAYGVLCQVLLGTELLAIFVALRLPCHLSTILGLESASRIVRTMGGWLPARIGIDESGMAAAALTFGLSSVIGLAIALARRVRDMSEALIGLSWLAWRARSSTRRNTGRQLVRTACA